MLYCTLCQERAVGNTLHITIGDPPHVRKAVCCTPCVAAALDAYAILCSAGIVPWYPDEGERVEYITSVLAGACEEALGGQ